MSGRDEFSPNTKEQLAKRAGYCCSFPGCGATTIGPSQEGATAIASTGMACHIVAAAGGRNARRVDTSLTPAQRSAFDNGIWMCYKHGRLIDTDEERFTIPLLKQWRQFAEHRAELSLSGSFFDAYQHDLFTHKILVTNDNLTEGTVGNAFMDAAVPVFWGEAISEAVRDFVFEITQNALTHGEANEVSIEFSPKRVLVTDNGNEFDSKQLKSIARGKGGAAAYKALRNVAGDQVLIISSRSSSTNSCEIRFIRTLQDLTSETPCHLDFAQDLEWGKSISASALASVETCEAVYVVLPDFMSFSKAMRFQEDGLLIALTGKQVIFVGRGISISVRDLLSRVSGSRFLALRDIPGNVWNEP